jgi:tetratricopeptide (TPR) repeat protein
MWRVRQANGNLVTFRELTTLQRWIVERKLSRDDEISLAGEKWKRLGDIGQLSGFFRVVDEAQRAAPDEVPIREPVSETRESSPAARLETTGSPRLDAGPNKRGLNRSLSLVLLLALFGGVSYLAYRYFIWVRQRQRQEQVETSHRSPVATPPQESPKADQLASQAALPPQVASPTREGESPPAKVDKAESAKLPGEAASSNFDSYMDKADRLREREQPRAALQAYRKAHELEPARPEALAGRGLALVDLGQTAPAIAAFEQALKIDPGCGLALMGLAEAYRAEGKKEQAMLYYEKYLAVVPDGPKAQVAKAAIKALQE